MSITFHPEHLSAFKGINEETHWVASRKARSWAVSVGADAAISAALPDERVDRSYLKEICADEAYSVEQCFLAIMAWGGMKVGHGERAWQVRKHWTEIVETLRAGRLSRREAYDRFHQFRQANPRCGIGPAYYTKLIFFADPRHDGYIMDQWTSLSINLLTAVGADFKIDMASGAIRGRRYDRVTERNTADIYEQFCLAIDKLAGEIGLSPEAVEERLFSSGGRHAGAWRTYVKANRPPLGSRR